MRRIITIAIVVLIGIAGVVLLHKGGSKSPQKKGVSSSSQIINLAKGMEGKNNLIEAKALYIRLINEYPGSKDISSWQKKLEELNTKLLLSPAPGPYSTTYEVKSGDSLTKIAQKYNTTVELIKEINGLTADIIIAGQKLKVVNMPFNLVIDKSQNVLMLKVKDEIIKTYIVSTGKDNSTPIGIFKIINKIESPTWFKTGAVIPPDSPENILGSRWMGFDLSGYGIHGTTEPQNLGRQITQGCVRMSNKDVEELFMIMSIGTEVTIID